MAFRQTLAERTQDMLDEDEFGLKPAESSGSGKSNLGRAASGVAGRVKELGNLLSDVDGLFQDVAAIEPPVGASAELRSSLCHARDALLDAALELGDMWKDEKVEVWDALPIESKVRRLQTIHDEIRRRRGGGCATDRRSSAINDIWLLRQRVSLDSDAARIAGLSWGSLMEDLARLRAGTDNG